MDIFDEVAQGSPPPAQSPTPDPSLWKDKTKILVTRNRQNGRVQRWKLVDGKAVLVSEERK